jgi:hypothetical protein
VAPGLAVGLDERNANLLFSPLARAQAPAGFGWARAALAQLEPTFLRVDVDFAQLEPVPGMLRLDMAADGCLRGNPPCAPFAGLSDQLAAAASQQRAHPGRFIVVIVVYGVPAWAARAPHGCERAGTAARSRPINAAGLAGYRRLIDALLVLGAQRGVSLGYWSPWNEPNHPYFISPQRATCASAARSRALAVYSTLARAMRDELAARGVAHHLILGELAAFPHRRPLATGVSELIGGLPRDVLCAADVFALHAYARRGQATVGPGAVREAERALDARGGCGRRLTLWVTETGAGAPHAGARRPRGPADMRAGCRELAGQLARWNADPRVTAAFQYTFREDTAFPVGLVDPSLTRLYPAFYAWRAWSARQGARGPAPPPVRECAP